MAILDVYTPNSRAIKYLKQKLVELKGQTGKSTTITGHFNVPLSTISRTTTQKTSKSIKFSKYHQPTESNQHLWNSLLNNSRIHILFKSHGTYTKVDHIIGHKTNLNKFKSHSVFPDHNGCKLEINNRKKNNTLLMNP